MIWNLAISRPVLTFVAFATIAIFGGYGYFRTPVREFPDVEFPVVSVNVVLPGAEPEVIETEVLEPLEEQINTVEGLKTLTSTAREQVAQILVEFELWRDIDIAAQDVRDRVNRAQRDLPQDIEPPIIAKLDPDEQAIIWIALTGDERWDGVRLTSYAEDFLQPRLENIRGVGQVQIGGSKRYAVRIELDPQLLAAHQLTVQDVVLAVQRNNVNIPSGRLRGYNREFLVQTRGQFSRAEPFNDLIVAVREGTPVRLQDVGRAVDGVEDERQLARFSGDLAVGLGIVKQSDANTVAVAEQVRSRMQELAEEFPPGLRYVVATDSSEFVESSVNDLLVTIVLTTSLVVLVVLSFLRSGWGTLVVAMAIPTSLLGGVASIYLLGFSLNTLTLLGLVLAIGIVVDDAIVVLESTYRHLEMGAEARPAARIGTLEVAFAAIANTLALAAVFIPVAFTEGLIGRFFAEFSLSVVLTVFFSTFTALTLTPMLNSRLLKADKKEPGRFQRAFNWVFSSVENWYVGILGSAFRHKVITLIVAAALFVAGYYLATLLDTEFTPNVDRSEFAIMFETPVGSTLEQTDQYAQKIEQVLLDHPQVKHFFLAIGLSMQGGPGVPSEGIAFVRLVDRDQRERHQSRIAQEVRRLLAEIPQGQAFVIELGGAGVQQGKPIEIALQSSDLQELARVQGTVMRWMRRQPLYVGVDSNFQLDRPEVVVEINRDKTSQIGVATADIANMFRYLLGEPEVSEIQREGDQFPTITDTTEEVFEPSALETFYLRNPEGRMVSLANLIRYSEDVGPSAIPHYNRIRAATISASMPPGVPLGDASSTLTQYLDENLPAGFKYEWAGQTQAFQESFQNLSIAMAFAVVFVYLVLAGQFESLLVPFTLLATLPLALVGAFLGLWALDMPLGIIAFIGLIMLVGMATKNAILMVDYSQVLMERGREVSDAAQEAAKVRFRPVIMTTISTVLGIMPIALGFGAGGEARAPMGVAVAAGLLATTGLTLIIIPVVFVLLEKLSRKVTGWVTR